VVLWITFLSFILVLLALDLGVFHRRARIISVREALGWTLIWLTTALAFAAVIYVGYDRHWFGMGLTPDPVERSALWPEGRVNDARSATLKFMTGYLVELSLSADNVFVIAMLFNYFAIPRIFQHRVLFWGILGALAMRRAQAEVHRAVAEVVDPLRAAGRRRLDHQLVPPHRLTRQRSRRQVGHVLRRRHAAGVDVAGLVLDSIQRAAHTPTVARGTSSTWLK